MFLENGQRSVGSGVNVKSANLPPKPAMQTQISPAMTRPYIKKAG